MAGPTLSLPTVGASNNTWGTTVNAAVNQINDYDVFARKTAAQSVTSNITKVDDTHLVSMPVLLNAVYVVQWDFRTDGAVAGDIRYAWAAPAGAAMTWESVGLAAGDVANAAPLTTEVAAIGTDVVHGTIAAGTISRIRGCGLLTMSTTAGTFKCQWAQGTSSATATRMLIDSWVLLRRVA